MSITWGAMHGLGAATGGGPGQGYTQLNDGSIVFSDGSVYGPDGQLITSNLGDSAIQLSDGSTVDQNGVYFDTNGNQVALTAFYQAMHPSAAGQKPSGKGFTGWLSQSVSPGWPSNGTVIGLAVAGTVGLSLLRGGRRR